MDSSSHRATTIEREISQELNHGHASRWLHMIIIIGSFLFTILSWHVSKLQIEEKVQNEFDREWSTLVQLVSDRMKNYEELLWSGVAAIESHDNKIDRSTWNSYAGRQALEKRFPGALGIGVIYEVERGNLPAFLAEQHALEPDFRIHPSVDLDTLYPITFIEPEASNKQAIGLDMTHEATRYEAILTARETGNATMTGPIQLVQGELGSPGFLFFAPFYENGVSDQSEKKLIGLVYSPLVFKNLILGTLGQDQRRVNFRLTDTNQVLFDEIEGQEDPDVEAMFVENKILSFYGREWAFEFHSTKELEKLLVSNLPAYILFGGLAFEIFYIAALWLLGKQRKNAVQLAQQIVLEYKNSAQRYDLAIKGSAVGLWDWDLVSEDLFWSDRFFEMLGVAGGKNHIDFSFFSERLHPEDLERVIGEVDEHLQSKKTFDTQYRLKHEQGHYIWVHASGQALWNEDGKAIRMSGSTSDITQSKLAAEEVLSLNDELTKFAHLASHDLKTPLRGISCLTQWIEEDQGDVLDAESVQRLQMIRDRALLTQVMLQDILTYSESGVASVQTEWVNPSTILTEIVDYMQLSEYQQVIFDENMPEIFTAPTQLRQVFSNAISNAFNHHDRSNQSVKITCLERSSGLEFTVMDDGPGIPEIHQKRVFELFQTLNPRGDGGGTGLGMSIIKRLVEAQHGEVRIESLDGTRGTSICFTWPAILNQEAA